MKVKINGKLVEAKLPKKFKEKWVKALRSGKYEQGSGKLKYQNKYCCLGVACAEFNPEVKLISGFIINEIAKNTTKIPEILKGDWQDNKLVDKLTDMNDSGKWSFNRIATYIEKYL